MIHNETTRLYTNTFHKRLDAIELQVTSANNFIRNVPLVAKAIITEGEGPLQCSRNAKQAVSAVKHKKRYVLYFFSRNICYLNLR